MNRITKMVSRLPLLNRTSEEAVNRLLLYLIIGVITFVVNNVLLFVFRRVMNMHDFIAVAASFAITSLCHFGFHNGVTFKKSAESFQRKFSGHLIVSIVNYFAGVSVATLVLRVVADNGLIATACSTAVTFLLGFSLLNRFVYKLHSKGETRDDHS